jgi:hypothetical protein
MPVEQVFFMVVVAVAALLRWVETVIRQQIRAV